MNGKKRKQWRWAGATVEMAIVTPLLLTMLFGIIEYGWIFSVKQAVTTAAREAARTASLPGSSVGEVEDRVASFMTPLGLTTYTVNLVRSTPQNPIETVTVTIPYQDVTLVGEFFGNTRSDIGSTCSMRKETLGSLPAPSP